MIADGSVSCLSHIRQGDLGTAAFIFGIALRETTLSVAAMQHQHLDLLRLCLALSLSAVSGYAMSVQAPTFNELVSRADTIVESEVVAKHCAWEGAGAERHIETTVTIKVDKVLTGTAPAQMQLRILGGTVDGQTLKVEGLTEFEVGDHDVLFLHTNGRYITPLVAMNYGRYFVITDAAKGSVPYIARSDGTPLRNVDELPVPLKDRTATRSALASGSGPTGTMTLADFEKAIISAASQAHPTPTR